MTTPLTESDYQQRAGRILDAATELLLRHGYRRVTVEDIAKAAGVGKGTVYLHWKTKQDVFALVVLRDAVDLFESLSRRMLADPAEVLMHRMVRTSFVEIMRRPISRALYTGDIEILGALAASDAPGMRHLRTLGRENDRRQVAALRAHGLLRTDLDLAAQLHALTATTMGFILLEGQKLFHDNDNDGPGLDIEAKADALATTIRHAFEPPGEPDRDRLIAAAAEILPLCDALLAECRALLPARTTNPGEN